MWSKWLEVTHLEGGGHGLELRPASVLPKALIGSLLSAQLRQEHCFPVAGPAPGPQPAVGAAPQ